MLGQFQQAAGATPHQNLTPSPSPPIIGVPTFESAMSIRLPEALRPTTPLWPVAILRVYLGAAFLSAASNKIFSWWASWPQNMAHFLTSKLNVTYGFYRPFLTSVVLAHVSPLARAVALTEVVVGLSLVLGVGTRYAATVGLVLIVNYLLALGEIPWQPGADQAFLIGLVVVLLTNGGKAFGLDQLLISRKRSAA